MALLLRELPSHHLLRRTARRRAAEYRKAYPAVDFRVVSSRRGPFGWRVERA